MNPRLVQYLAELASHLRLNPARERQVLREVYTHLEERVRDLEAQGHSSAEAIRRATESFGKPQSFARAIYEVYNTGTWKDAILAATPYVLVAFLFGLHLWQSSGWLIVFLTTSVAVTLISSLRGRPIWVFPWAGFCLVLPLASGIIAGAAVLEAGKSLWQGKDVALPLWVVLGLLAYIPLAAWMIISALLRVIRRDWLYASLMLLPFPILVRWLLSLQVEGSSLTYNTPFFSPGADAAIAVVFLLLAHLPVLFVRLRHRTWKIAALVLATPPAFIVAAYNTPGSTNILALLFLAILSVLFLLTPALWDLAIGRRAQRRSGSHWVERTLSGA